MRLIEGRSFYKEPWHGSYHSMMDRCYRKKAHIEKVLAKENLRCHA